jgi:hypothetical protein
MNSRRDSTHRAAAPQADGTCVHNTLLSFAVAVIDIYGFPCNRRDFSYLNATSTSSDRKNKVGRILGEQDHFRTA